MNHDEQDWNYLLHFGTFKRMLLEGKIDENALLDYIAIWRNQKSWHGINQFLGIEGEQFLHLMYYPDNIKEVLSIDDRNELVEKFPIALSKAPPDSIWSENVANARRNQYVCKKCGCHFKKVNGEYVCWNCGSRKISKKDWCVVERA